METEIAPLEQEHALEAVATKHRAWLVRRLALVVGDAAEAEDVARQTLLRSAGHWSSPDGTDVEVWLVVVGIRLALTAPRHRRWAFLALPETDDGWAMTTDSDLWLTLSELDRRTRAALVLTVLHGTAEDEVAEMIDVPRATVTRSLSRGRARLRDVLETESAATEGVDAELRVRLEALANAVPVSPEPAPVTRVSRSAGSPRVSGFSLLATAAAVGLVVVLASGAAGGGPPEAARVVASVPASSDVTIAVPTPAARVDPGRGAVIAAPGPSAHPTRPPAGTALSYPDGCPAYDLSARRCAYIVDWARAQAGLPPDGGKAELLGDPDCEAGTTLCPLRLGGERFVVRIRITRVSGASKDYAVLCGIVRDSSLLCADSPKIGVRSPMLAYHDVPCGPNPAPGGCASPVPGIRPSAAAKAIALQIWTVEIPVDHVGDYSVGLGDAILPNGILTDASATLADNRRADVVIPDGIRLEVVGDDGPLVNAYRQGWRPGTERVHVRLSFRVESFDPGAALYITNVVVR